MRLSTPSCTVIVPGMATAWLVPVAGPTIAPLVLSSKDGGVIVGRHESSDIKLPPDADKISRNHAKLQVDESGARWTLTDLKSSWGTYLNGVRLTPLVDMPLSEGDLVRLTPWTFHFTLRGLPQRGMRTSDDGATLNTMVRALSPDRAQPAKSLGDDLLGLLLEGAAAIHGATDEKALADVILDAAVRGTGMTHAAVLKSIDNEGRIEIVAHRVQSMSGSDDAGGAASFSRTLLATASTGVVAELGGAGAAPVSQSIVSMQISAALCVPLMLGQTPAAYLYLDSRGRRGGAPGQLGAAPALRANASSFCLALGRIASLALANLKRIDIEKRQAMLEAELGAAAVAQKWILPARTGGNDRFKYVGQSVPGQYVGGDFFDVIPLSDGRLAVALGDVSGKGISASVLMTAAQGFLHASLAGHGDVARAVNQLNAFLHPRRQASKFITLWVGVFSPAPGGGATLSYVDAGHGHALLRHPDGTFSALASGDGLPVGVFDEASYTAETLDIPAGGLALILSDGIIEQFGIGTAAQQFEMTGVQQAVSAGHGDVVAALFEAVVTHAGKTQLADDATAVVVTW